MSETVFAGGHTYVVNYDRTTTFDALVMGAVIDDAGGKPVLPPYNVAASDSTLRVSAKPQGYLIAGDPDVNLADHSVAHALTLNIDASGYRPKVVAVTVPANPLFPVVGPDAALRRRPVALRGRIYARRTGNPLPAAQLTLTGPALPAPQQAILLASPLVGDLSAAATVQGHALTPVGSAVPIKTVSAPAEVGATAIQLNDRQNLAPGQLLRIGSPARPRFVQIAVVSPTPPNPALPGEVTLTEPLAFSARFGDGAAPFTLGGVSGPLAHPIGDAFAGEAVLILDAAANGDVLVISDPAAPTDRFAKRDVTCDGRGEYFVDGITRLPQLVLTAAGGGLTALVQTWPVNWDSPITTFDWALTP